MSRVEGFSYLKPKSAYNQPPLESIIVITIGCLHNIISALALIRFEVLFVGITTVGQAPFRVVYYQAIIYIIYVTNCDVFNKDVSRVVHFL